MEIFLKKTFSVLLAVVMIVTTFFVGNFATKISAEETTYTWKVVFQTPKKNMGIFSMRTMKHRGAEVPVYFSDNTSSYFYIPSNYLNDADVRRSFSGNSTGIPYNVGLSVISSENDYYEAYIHVELWVSSDNGVNWTWLAGNEAYNSSDYQKISKNGGCMQDISCPIDEVSSYINNGKTNAAYMAAEGKCGPDATWLYENNKVTISGTGAMYSGIGSYPAYDSYYESLDYPWEYYTDYIEQFSITEGITSISIYLLSYCDYYLPKSLTSLSIASYNCCYVYSGSEAEKICMNLNYKFVVLDGCFAENYSFNKDHLSFGNLTDEFDDSYIYNMYGSKTGESIKKSFSAHGTSGQCYGMAVTTGLLLNNDYSRAQFSNGTISSLEPSDIYGNTQLTLSDIIKYSFIYQKHGLPTKEKTNKTDLDMFYYAVESYVNGTGEPVLVNFDIIGILYVKELVSYAIPAVDWDLYNHTVLAVGIGEDTLDYTEIYIDDSNYKNGLRSLYLYKTYNGADTDSYVYSSWNYRDTFTNGTHKLSFQTDVYNDFLSEIQNEKYTGISSQSSSTSHTSNNAILVKIAKNFFSKLIDTIIQFFYRLFRTSANENTFIYIDENGNEIEFEFIPDDDFKYFSDDDSDYYWYTGNEPIQIDSGDDSGDIALYSDEKGIEVHLSPDTEASIDLNDIGGSVSFTDSDGKDAVVSFVSTDENGEDVVIQISGEITGENAEINSETDSIQLEGIKDVEVRMETAEGVVEAQADVQDGREIQIFADEIKNEVVIVYDEDESESSTEPESESSSEPESEPSSEPETEPSSEPETEPSSENVTEEPATQRPNTSNNKCKYCNQEHTGFFGAIIQLIHNILYFFKNLF